MGQKTHPIGFRLGVTRTWSSRWFATKGYADLLHEDHKIRRYIKSALYHAGISRIDIERSANRARITIFTARPGIITGLLLGFARISGETAPLLFTALNNQFWTTDISGPTASLPTVIFQFALSPYKDWQQLAWTGALIITATVLILSIAARSLGSTRTAK